MIPSQSTHVRSWLASVLTSLEVAINHRGPQPRTRIQCSLFLAYLPSPVPLSQDPDVASTSGIGSAVSGSALSSR
jgi:hypothetical protein